MFVGVGASRVRDLFQSARKMGRAIIFIDEIDSIGRKRGAGLGGGHDEREQTLNQMLAEMDGFETSEGIVILAATNRPDILDPALLRPGRFDRQIVVPLPEFDERLAILRVHSRDKRLGPDADLEVMAKGTPGMSGADLANLVNEAALFAVRRGSRTIDRIDFESARDRIMMGARRESLVLTAEEKRVTAYHEGGHAVLAAVLPNGDPLHKVTILPRGMALGVTQTLPEERHSFSREYIEDRICMALGGRVAEELVFGQRTTGAANDLEVITGLARRMVREWGMSDRIGPMAWQNQQHVFLGEDLMTGGRDYSDDTARLVDEEVQGILRVQEDRARELLAKHRPGLDLVAAALLDRETIDGVRGGPAGPAGSGSGVRQRPRAGHGGPAHRAAGRRAAPHRLRRSAQAVGRLTEVGFGRRARPADLGHGGPQVGGGDGPDEAGPDHAGPVGHDEERHGIDVVAPVHIGPGAVLGLVDGHLATGQHGRLRHHVGARVARRRGEHHDEPRSRRAGEVPPVELGRHLPQGRLRGRRRAAGRLDGGRHDHGHHDQDPGDQDLRHLTRRGTGCPG